MRATIFPLALMLTKVGRAAVSMMAKLCIVACVLPQMCFLFLLPNIYSYLCNYNVIFSMY